MGFRAFREHRETSMAEMGLLVVERERREWLCKRIVEKWQKMRQRGRMGKDVVLLIFILGRAMENR